MGSIDKVSTGWRARYRTPEGQQRSRTFKRKIDADRFLTGVEHRKLSGDYIDPAAGRVTFREYAEWWRTMQVHRPTTAAQVEGNLRNRVYPSLGDRQLSSLRPSHVQAMVKAMSLDLAPASVETIYRHVSAVFKAAVRDRLIARSPCEGITLPKADKDHKVIPLEVEQLAAIADLMPERWQAAVWLGAGTGLRQGEVLGLTADRVDFLRRTVKVDRQLVTSGPGAPTLAPPKTKASYRTVPLPDSVGFLLAEHLRQFPVGDDGLIFTMSDGAPVRRQRMADPWRNAAQSLGLPPRTGFHATRHFYASALIQHGESVKVVQARLGHASAIETLDTYGHLWPDSEDATRAVIDLVLSATSSVTGVSGKDAAHS